MAEVRELELGRELVNALSEVEAQIQATRNVAIELGCTVYQLRDSRGGFMLAPLLHDKSQLLHALTLLNRREK